MRALKACLCIPSPSFICLLVSLRDILSQVRAFGEFGTNFFYPMRDGIRCDDVPWILSNTDTGACLHGMSTKYVYRSSLCQSSSLFIIPG